MSGGIIDPWCASAAREFPEPTIPVVREQESLSRVPLPLQVRGGRSRTGYQTGIQLRGMIVSKALGGRLDRGAHREASARSHLDVRAERPPVVRQSRFWAQALQRNHRGWEVGRFEDPNASMGSPSPDWPLPLPP